jgi:FkbM family methyltransferase
MIKANRPLYKVYTDLRYRRLAKIRNWILKNQQFIAKNNLGCFVYYNNGRTYVRVNEKLEFLYVPDILGGVLGLELDAGFESKESAFLLSQIKEGQTVLDVGANFGFYSVLIGQQFENISIHSFEPVHSTFAILKHNVEHNRLQDKVTLNECGVGEKTGQTKMTQDKYSGNHLVINENSNDVISDVLIITIDSYVQKNNIEKVDVIKCDIEGAEYLMLKGAINLLKKDYPNIFIEIADEWTSRFGYSARDVIHYLLNIGYTYKVFSQDGQLLPQSTDIDYDISIGSNYYFSKPESK